MKSLLRHQWELKCCNRHMHQDALELWRLALDHHIADWSSVTNFASYSLDAIQSSYQQ